jgi:FkbM family methyltransferase
VSDKLEQFPLKSTPVDRRNRDKAESVEPRVQAIGLEKAFAEETHGADFRFLPTIRAAMAETAPPIPAPLKKKKRRGLRRVMREIARPFEQLSEALRKTAGFTAKAGSPAPWFGIRARPRRDSTFHHPSELPAMIQAICAKQNQVLRSLAALRQDGQIGRTRDGVRGRRRAAISAVGIKEIRQRLGALQELQAIGLRRMKRQPIPVAGELLLIGLDDRYAAVPSCDFALVAALIDEPVYEPGVSAVLRQLATGKALVIDVGANIGLHSITMARAMRREGKILALEPTPRTFEALRVSLLLNGLLTRADMRRIAAGAQSREMLLHCHPVSGQNSLYGYPNIETQQISVPVAPLDSLVSPGTAVDVVKIDAEGAEFEILKGMTRILAQASEIAVVLEFSAAHFERAGASPAELVEFMASFGLWPQLIDDRSGRVESFDLGQVLRLPAANLLFQRERPSASSAGRARTRR